MTAVFTARPGRALQWSRGDRVNWSAIGLECEECGARHGVTPDGGEWSARAVVSLQVGGFVPGLLCDRCRDHVEIRESGA